MSIYLTSYNVPVYNVFHMLICFTCSHFSCLCVIAVPSLFLNSFTLLSNLTIFKSSPLTTPVSDYFTCLTLPCVWTLLCHLSNYLTYVTLAFHFHIHPLQLFCQFDPFRYVYVWQYFMFNHSIYLSFRVLCLTIFKVPLSHVFDPCCVPVSPIDWYVYFIYVWPISYVPLFPLV